MFAMKQSGLGKNEMNVAGKRIYKVKSEVLEDLKTGYTKLDKFCSVETFHIIVLLDVRQCNLWNVFLSMLDANIA